jgi:hypothetical protein
MVLLSLLAGVVAVGVHRARVPNLPAALVVAFPALVGILTLSVGVWIAIVFWPRREGLGLHCKRCGYFQERQGRLAPACPECGAPWLWIGNTSRGRPAGRYGMLALGLCLCLLTLGAMLTSSVTPWVVLRLMPDRALLTQVTVLPDAAATGYWEELLRRNLPRATMDALAGPLLQKKARDGYLSTAAEAVVLAAMLSPGAPPALSDRYFASFVSQRTAVPSEVAPGTQIQVRTTATFRGGTLTSAPAPRVVVVSALYLDDAAEPLEHWEWEVDPAAAPVQERAMDATLESLERGTHRLRRVFWLVVSPGGEGPIRWAVGQPVLPVMMSVKNRFEAINETRVALPPSPKPR